MKASGIDTPNHKQKIPNMIEKGTKPDDCSYLSTRFRMKKMTKHAPGKRSAVWCRGRGRERYAVSGKDNNNRRARGSELVVAHTSSVFFFQCWPLKAL